ncbi:hypothetical protein KUCAC02_032892 [Chaenocephalus aceratus]|nr:hypothetical protein KUCAC02_036516 [Chaenocephalus aceratus]KAI4793178.1 hypothetical protein KUCAC02_032892 [Chaenocephalus aceratus]
MLAFLFLLGLALGAVSSDNLQMEDTCPSFWISFNGRCYKYFDTERTWADAEFHCVSQGGNLVSIHSTEEEDFVKTMFPADGYTWNGLNDIYEEGKWMWSDGCAAKYLFWYSGQPNNRGLGEDCVINNWKGKWNDAPCSTFFPSVCASRRACP